MAISASRRAGMADCVLWTGPVLPSGYGRRGKVYVHREAWELAYGPIPDGLQIDHLCHEPLCLNVTHMQLLDASTHGRKSCTERWATIGDSDLCRHGHLGERRQDCAGHWYCRACNRERTRRYRYGYKRGPT